jgi:hypothetical protein
MPISTARPRRPSPSRHNEQGKRSPVRRQGSSSPSRAPSSPAANDRGPTVPEEVIKTYPQLSVSFSSLPRDLWNPDALPLLFTERFGAIGWQYDSCGQRSLGYLLVFHSRQDLEVAADWLGGPAKAYWSSNHVQVQPVHPNAARKHWTWSEMKRSFRESWGVDVETMDPARRSAEGRPWWEFKWESKRRAMEAEAFEAFDSTRWAPLPLDAFSAHHPAQGAEDAFWSGPSAWSRGSWIADKFRKFGGEDVDRPQDTTTTYKLDYYGPHREEESQGTLERGEIVESTPDPSVPPNNADALITAFAHSPSPLVLNQDQDLVEYDQSLVDLETAAKGSPAPFRIDPLPAAVDNSSTQAASHPAMLNCDPSSSIDNSLDSQLPTTAFAIGATDDQVVSAEQQLIVEVETAADQDVMEEEGRVSKGDQGGEMEMRCEGGETGAGIGKIEVEVGNAEGEAEFD